METAEYRIMYDLETSYWWFRNIHDILTDLIRPSVTPTSKVLDAGCGTGGLMLRLNQLSRQTYGLDLSADAAAFWDERGVKPRTNIASINELPYPANQFDAVLSVDILECDGVEDKRAYAELVRVTQPGGLIVIVVPAYQWMMTEGHHKAVHAVRRYNKKSTRALADDQPVQIERLTHGFAALFPMVGGVRLWHKFQERRGPVEIQSELQPLPAPLNSLLYHITNLERYLLRTVNMPFGSSLIMLARKK